MAINIENPSHYEGGREWILSSKGINNYDSTSSTSTHTPKYSPARSSISIALSN